MTWKNDRWTTHTSILSIPSILQIDRESRAIGLHLYKGMFSREQISSTNPYICTAQDTIAVDSMTVSIKLLQKLCCDVGVKYLALPFQLAYDLQKCKVDFELEGTDIVYGLERLRAFETEGCAELQVDNVRKHPYSPREVCWMLPYRRTQDE